MEKKQTNKIRLITGTAMLTAVAVGLQYVEIAIPIMPSFIKLDFSDLPELIGRIRLRSACRCDYRSFKKLNSYGCKPERLCR